VLWGYGVMGSVIGGKSPFLEDILPITEVIDAKTRIKK
jgi:hypothetical protein